MEALTKTTYEPNKPEENKNTITKESEKHIWNTKTSTLDNKVNGKDINKEEPETKEQTQPAEHKQSKDSQDKQSRLCNIWKKKTNKQSPTKPPNKQSPQPQW